MLSLTFRSIRRERALSIASALMLALGVAALTTAFGLVNAALFRQPPFERADRLSLLFLERNPRGEGPSRERWSFARLEMLGASQHSFESIASFSPTTLTLSTPSGPESVQAERV